MSEDFCEHWSLIGCNVGTVQDCEHWSMIHLFRIAAPFSVYKSQNKNILKVNKIFHKSIFYQIFQTYWKKIDILNKPCKYALNLVRIRPRDDTTYRIGSVPYKNVPHITLAYLGWYTSSIGHLFFFIYARIPNYGLSPVITLIDSFCFIRISPERT